MQSTYPSVDEWIKCCIFTTEYDSATRKGEFLPSATIWTNLEGIVLSEVKQSKNNIT